MLIVSITESDTCLRPSTYCFVAPETSFLPQTYFAFSTNYNSIISHPSDYISTVPLKSMTATASSNEHEPLSNLAAVTTTTPSTGYSCQFFTSLQFATMVFRPTTGNWLSLLRNGFAGGKATYTSSTVPKMKAYAPTADYGYVPNQYQQPHGKSSKSAKHDFVPVYMAIGAIALSTGLGLHTAWQQLRNSPTVRVKKQRRETLPEVVEPEHVAEESDRFIKKSFFRKVAHVQERSYPDHHHIPDPVHKDAYAYPPRVETLKSVGVDPSHV